MPNMGGKSGQVEVTTSATGDTVKVVYPAIPASPGPPPNVGQSAHVDTFEEPDWAIKRFREVVPPAEVVDVTVDGSGNPTTIKTHG